MKFESTIVSQRELILQLRVNTWDGRVNDHTHREDMEETVVDLVIGTQDVIVEEIGPETGEIDLGIVVTVEETALEAGTDTAVDKRESLVESCTLTGFFV